MISYNTLIIVETSKENDSGTHWLIHLHLLHRKNQAEVHDGQEGFGREVFQQEEGSIPPLDEACREEGLLSRSPGEICSQMAS